MPGFTALQLRFALHWLGAGDAHLGSALADLDDWLGGNLDELALSVSASLDSITLRGTCSLGAAPLEQAAAPIARFSKLARLLEPTRTGEWIEAHAQGPRRGCFFAVDAPLFRARWAVPHLVAHQCVAAWADELGLERVTRISLGNDGCGELTLRGTSVDLQRALSLAGDSFAALPPIAASLQRVVERLPTTQMAISLQLAPGGVSRLSLLVPSPRHGDVTDLFHAAGLQVRLAALGSVEGALGVRSCSSLEIRASAEGCGLVLHYGAS